MAKVTFKNSDLHLEIPDREFVVLAGPAGCGCSAILRTIAGLETAHGDIFIGERRVSDVAPSDRDIALVSKDYAPYPRMSVQENMAFALRSGKFSQSEVKKRVLAVAEMLGLQELLDRMPELLSPEERQSVALARAIVRQPKVFLFDEPFSNLDWDARARGRAEINKLRQRLPAATMIYATHNPIEAMAVGDRLIILDRGAVQQDAIASAIYQAPANLFVAGFAGQPPMNLVHGSLKQDRDSLIFSERGDGTIKVRLPVTECPGAQDFAGQAIVLGIRPEDIEVAAPANEPQPSANGFRALVELVEPTGAEGVLYLQTGAHALVCRTRDGMGQNDAGHRLQFEMNLAKGHFFDPTSGRRIAGER